MSIHAEAGIRQLTAADLPNLLELSYQAGWNQLAADWLLLLELQPESCLGLEIGGHMVATATLTRYQDRLGWLGMVLTHPTHRRRGFARQLVGSCLEIATAYGIETIKLDATDSGLPLYESFGFVREEAIERWAGHGSASNTISPNTGFDEPDYSLDRAAFGADRSAVLNRLAEIGSCRSNESGFAMVRPGANAEYLGPCVASSQEAARLLIADRLATSQRQFYWDLKPANAKALEFATGLGFRRARSLTRMRKGADVRGIESMIYAAAGFELG